MHTIHDPKKIIVNPHNRVGITEIHHPLHNEFKKYYMATWPNLNATQGKFTNSCSGYKGSVGSPVHASTLQATDQEMGPSLHRHRRTPHLHHHSLPHNLTKLIARDKAVSTFSIVLANHPKESD
jgi:hypothetical protein